MHVSMILENKKTKQTINIQAPRTDQKDFYLRFNFQSVHTKKKNNSNRSPGRE